MWIVNSAFRKVLGFVTGYSSTQKFGSGIFVIDLVYIKVKNQHTKSHHLCKGLDSIRKYLSWRQSFNLYDVI